MLEIIRVSKESKYQVELMRWPKEVGRAIREGIPASTIAIPGGEPFGEGKALPIEKARLQIQHFDSTMPVMDKMKAASFIVDLEKGKTKLKTWFTGDQELSLGAYYVYITKN